MRLYRGKIFARWVYKDTNARDDMTTTARNPRFLMPLFGQKTGFSARMNEIKSGIPCSDDDDALLFLLDGCVCIEVKYLQDGFTKLQTHAMT